MTSVSELIRLPRADPDRFIQVEEAGDKKSRGVATALSIA
jgi:hypothetical protein